MPDDANLSRTRLARLIADGQVTLNGAVVTDPKTRVTAGDSIAITVPEAEDSHIGPEDIALTVVFEDDDLIVIDKPAGMVVHPAPGSPSGTLVNALLAHCGDALSGVGGMKRPGIVHRIDKDTSGLLVVAKSDRAHHGLAAQFEKHTVERQYKAVVYGLPGANDRRLRGVRGAPGGLPCRLLAGNRAHPPDPGAYGPCRSRACGRSDLWRAAQAGARCGIRSGRRCRARFSTSGPACATSGLRPSCQPRNVAL